MRSVCLAVLGMIWILSQQSVFGKSLDAHVHGSATLTIGVESKDQIEIEFSSPAESIVGFEHEAKSEKDKTTQKEKLDLLKSKSAAFLIFPKESSCTIQPKKVAIEFESEDDEDHEHHKKKEDKHEGKQSGQHSEVKAVYSVACKTIPASLDLNFESLFPSLKEVRVNVLSKSKQNSTLVKKGKGSIKIEN
jgi:hypothetical protein